MGERKVLNRYFPPDFDPLLVPKRKYDPYKQVEVRMMIPFSLQCIKCGEYMYRGKKFNSRKEDVIGDDYLGIKKYRFYIKCCVCNNEIAFKTDPKNQDYVCESGAWAASFCFFLLPLLCDLLLGLNVRRSSSAAAARLCCAAVALRRGDGVPVGDKHGAGGRERSGQPARHRRDTLRRRHAQLRVLAPAGRGRGEVRGRAQGGGRGERDVRARVEDA